MPDHRPILDFTTVTTLPSSSNSIPVVDDDGDTITSFTKILTPSDVNSGAGLSVPKYCAESIFPILDLEAAEYSPPAQTLEVTDVHGEVWKFRHIHRGSPKRHLLTTGWRNFVNRKRLIAGDNGSPWRMLQRDLRGTEACIAQSARALSEWTHGWNQSLRLGANALNWITWDDNDPILLQNFKWVSPWQVELVPTIPTPHAAYPPPAKKFRPVDGSGIFPAAGMQASHDSFSSSSFSNFLGGNSSVNNTVPRLKTLSTELSLGISQSDDLQSDSQSSLLSFGTESSLNHSCNSTKPVSVSFQLFGAIIQLEEQTVEIGSHGNGCIGGDSSKSCNETEGDDNPLDGSVSYLNLLDRLDDQCQRG